MPDLIFKLAYIAGLIAEIVIRAPYNQSRRRAKIVSDQMSRQEGAVLPRWPGEQAE